MQAHPEKGIGGKCRHTGKKQHETEREAREHAKSLRKRVGPKTHPYKCPYCGFWHVGHSRKRR